MTVVKCTRGAFAALACLTLLPAAALAQSSITGEVSDNTGGVLPGVTVEVSSPALIEGSRVAVSDGTGRYTVIDLRPGTYSVTMSLPGFSTFVQEGLELQANFTLTVNGALSVGALEETVTVSGEAPIVDVQSAARTEVLQRDTIDALPTPRNTQSIGYLAQGVRLTIPDVGGAQMMEQVQMVSHGANSDHSVMQVDGMMVNAELGDGRIMNYNNQALSQEMAVSTSGSPAEVSAGGLRLNMIPKDGGNNFSGSNYVGFTDGGWQAKNLTPTLNQLGLESTQGVSNIHDVNPAVGGPILRDKLWYFTSVRGISVDELWPNAFVPTFRQGASQEEIEEYFRTFDRDHPAVESREDAIVEQYVRSALFRVTSQVSQRNKVSAYLDRIFKFKAREFYGNTEPIRASSHRDPEFGNYHTAQAKWTSTISSRALLEVGYSQVYERLRLGYQPNTPIAEGGAGRQLAHPKPDDLRTCILTPCYHPLSYDQTGGWFDDVRFYDRGTGLTTHAYTYDILVTPADRRYPNASFSYVTGSHNFKVGMQWSMSNGGVGFDGNGSLLARFNEGAPEQVSVYNLPAYYNTYVRADRGIYAQDTWTIDRLTINAGVRFEQFQSGNDTYRAGAGIGGGRFIGGRLFNAQDQTPFWNDIAPRFSVVYDLFGDARTALKFSVNRFMKPWTNGFARRYHPISLQSDTRDWFDCALHPDIHTGGAARCATAADLAAVGMPDYTGTNGDFIAQDHEIGTVGTNAVVFTSGELAQVGQRPDPDLQREYNIEWSGSIQHEIAPRVSLTAAYYRRVFYDIEHAENRALRGCDVSTAQVGVPCGDWIPFNVTFDDPGGRLGYLGGIGQAPTLADTSFMAFNQDPATRTLKDIVHVNSDVNRNYYNGLELSLQARLPNGGTLFGGWTMHQHVQDTCGLTQNPNGVSQADMIDRNRTTLRGGRFCDQSAIGIPFRNDFKLFGAYPLPADFEFSGSIQAYSGNEREMRWTITDAYYPGGNLTDNQGVQMFAPGTHYFGYWTQVDFAIRRLFRVGNWEYSAQLDIYNALNASAIIDEADSYGSGYATPTRLLQGRLARLAFQVKW